MLGGQRRVRIYDTQIQALDRLMPLLQRRVEAGASSPAEIGRAQIAADLVRAERERARTAARDRAPRAGGRIWACDSPSISARRSAISSAPATRRRLPAIVRSLDSHPQLVRWTAVRAQRDAEIISARLKSIPDVRASAGWRHYRETDDNAVRLGASVALPVWDQNLGGITEAREARAQGRCRTCGRAPGAGADAGARLRDHAGRAARARAAAALRPAERAARPSRRSRAATRRAASRLLEVLDIQNTATQTALREQEVLVSFHTAVATLEGLTGIPVGLTFARQR